MMQILYTRSFKTANDSLLNFLTLFFLGVTKLKSLSGLTARLQFESPEDKK